MHVRIWEASVAFVLDHDPNVDAGLRNDHLVFKLLDAYKGVMKKYLPDFLICLTSGKMSVLEVSGQGSQQDQPKRKFLAEWCRAVNEKGWFGLWGSNVSFQPQNVRDILADHKACRGDAELTDAPSAYSCQGRSRQPP